MTDTIEKQIETAVNILKIGGLVAYPTDTVYGLGACYDNEAAVKRIFMVKKRPFTMALPLLLADISWIYRYAAEVPPAAVNLSGAFLPGGLTLVLKKSSSVPDFVSAGKDTVAVRVPAHSVILSLINKTGKPIIGTSANLSGKPSALTSEEVKSQIGDTIDFVVDGGACPGGIESTIIDVTGEMPVVIRQGAIAIEEIQKICQIRIKE